VIHRFVNFYKCLVLLKIVDLALQIHKVFVRVFCVIHRSVNFYKCLVLLKIARSSSLKVILSYLNISRSPLQIHKVFVRVFCVLLKIVYLAQLKRQFPTLNF
jgi:hypothetical protein